MMMRRSSLIAVLALLATPALAGGPTPFKSRVVATWDNIFTAFSPEGASFSGYGQTTHMGRALQEGKLFLAPTPNEDGLYPGYGFVTLTAPDGSTATFVFTGGLNPANGVGSGEFVFLGGTGRFAQVSGSGTFYAVIDLSQPTNQPMTVVLDGTIAF